MESYDYLATRIAEHWYRHYPGPGMRTERLLEQQIMDRYLSRCDTTLARRILLIIGHQKVLHLYLNDPETRKPPETAFRSYERVSKRLCRLLQ
jgi:hypothetical protein